MAESRYEKYVVRKPNTVRDDHEVVIEKLDIEGRPSTGPLVFSSLNLIKDSKALLEAGLIWEDSSAGTGEPGTFIPHKHGDFDEIFLFMGTDPKDPMDLGAEAEFWLGEEETLEKVVVTTSSSVYVPAGVGHFPLIFKNVRRPIVFAVVGCIPYDYEKIDKVPVSLKGRPKAADIPRTG
jgi:hypothetical protein